MQFLVNMKKLSEEKIARMLVDQLVGNEDPFGLARYCLSQFAASLVEAWTPEEERKAVGDAAKHGMTMVDHAVIGNYDLVLWKSPPGVMVGYAVSINNSGHSPADKDTQLSKFHGEVAPLTQLRAKINEWIDLHGTLVVGSYVPKRNALYLKLIRRMFPERKIASYYSDDFSHGFSISK